MEIKQVVLSCIAAFVVGISGAFFAANIKLNVAETRLVALEHLYADTIESNKKRIAEHHEILVKDNVQLNVQDTRLQTLESLYQRSVIKNRETISEHGIRLALVEQRLTLLFDKRSQLTPKKSAEESTNANTISHEGKNM